MLKKVIAIFLLIAGFVFVGCEKNQVIRTADGKNLIQPKAGEEFIISLFANPSTGYQWELSKELDKDLVELVGKEFTGKDPNLVGAGGAEEWKFKALKPGKTSICLKYLRPCEKGIPPVKEETFEVEIK